MKKIFFYSLYLFTIILNPKPILFPISSNFSLNIDVPKIIEKTNTEKSLFRTPDNSILLDPRGITLYNATTSRLFRLNVFQSFVNTNNYNNSIIAGGGIAIVSGTNNIHRASITINTSESGFDIICPRDNLQNPISLYSENDNLVFGKKSLQTLVSLPISKTLNAFSNTTFGNNNFQYLQNFTINSNNIAFGNNNGIFANGSFNIFMGSQIMSGTLKNLQTTGNHNIGIGKYCFNSLNGLVNGPNNHNIAIGRLAGLSLQDGSNNIFIGPYTGTMYGGTIIDPLNIIDIENNLLSTTGSVIRQGNNNIALGNKALHLYATGTFTGSDNIAIGTYAGSNLDLATSNAIFLGSKGPLKATKGTYIRNIDQGDISAVNLTRLVRVPSSNLLHPTFPAPVLIGESEQLGTITNGTRIPSALPQITDDTAIINELSSLPFIRFKSGISTTTNYFPLEYEIDINNLNFTNHPDLISCILTDETSQKRTFNYYKIIPMMLVWIKNLTSSSSITNLENRVNNLETITTNLDTRTTVLEGQVAGISGTNSILLGGNMTLGPTQTFTSNGTSIFNGLVVFNSGINASSLNIVGPTNLQGGNVEINATNANNFFTTIGNTSSGLDVTLKSSAANRIILESSNLTDPDAIKITGNTTILGQLTTNSINLPTGGNVIFSPGNNSSFFFNSLFSTLDVNLKINTLQSKPTIIGNGLTTVDINGGINTINGTTNTILGTTDINTILNSNTTIGNNAGIGKIKIQSGNTLTDAINLIGKTTVTGDAKITGNLIVDGSLTYSNITTDLTIPDQLIVNGTATMNNIATFNSTVAINSNPLNNGITSIGNLTSLTGTISLRSNNASANALELLGNTSINTTGDKITLIGNTASTLGIISLKSGSSNTNAIEILGNLSVNTSNNLSITLGNLLGTGKIALQSNNTNDDAIKLKGKITIDGTTKHTDNVTINGGSLSVTNGLGTGINIIAASNFITGGLAVTGLMGISGGMTLTGSVNLNITGSSGTSIGNGGKIIIKSTHADPDALKLDGKTTIQGDTIINTSNSSNTSLGNAGKIIIKSTHIDPDAIKLDGKTTINGITIINTSNSLNTSIGNAGKIIIKSTHIDPDAIKLDGKTTITGNTKFLGDVTIDGVLTYSNSTTDLTIPDQLTVNGIVTLKNDTLINASPTNNGITTIGNTTSSTGKVSIRSANTSSNAIEILGNTSFNASNNLPIILGNASGTGKITIQSNNTSADAIKIAGKSTFTGDIIINAKQNISQNSINPTLSLTNNGSGVALDLSGGANLNAGLLSSISISGTTDIQGSLNINTSSNANVTIGRTPAAAGKILIQSGNSDIDAINLKGKVAIEGETRIGTSSPTSVYINTFGIGVTTIGFYSNLVVDGAGAAGDVKINANNAANTSIGASGKTLIKSTNTATDSITIDGKMSWTNYNAPFSGTNLVIESTGILRKVGPSTSSKRFKENIKEITPKLIKKFDLMPTPKTFNFINQPEVTNLGFIAEDFDEADLKEFVFYDDEKKPYSLKYNDILILFLAKFKEYQQETEKRIHELEEKIILLQKP